VPTPPKIVLTGAPGSGKSTIARALEQRHPGQFIVVPEAATQYYSGLGRKWNQLTLEQQRDAQRAIYRLQLAQEERLRAENPGRVMLLDRGTIDGSAYWPDGPSAYWTDLGTTEDAQFGRYDHVIVLETAAVIGLYDGDASNHVRFEGAAEAIENARKLASLWAGHANVSLVRAEADLARKVDAVAAIVATYLVPAPGTPGEGTRR
jgi:predicted ATPase